MRRPIVSKSERSGTGVDMANLSKAVCHGESDKCRFGNPPQESNSQRLGITAPAADARLLREKGESDIGQSIERVSDAMQRHVARELARTRVKRVRRGGKPRETPV